MNEPRCSLFSTSLIPTKDVSGIYALIDSSNQKLYVGSTKCFQTRAHCWRTQFKRKKIVAQRIMEAMEKNPDAFEFCVIEETKPGVNLFEREQFWMDFYKSNHPENGYNMHPTAGSTKNPPPETRRLMSEKRTGKKHPPVTAESRLKYSLAGCKKPIIQLSDSGQEIERFRSIVEASRKLAGRKWSQPIFLALKGRQKSALGFKWKYA